jgi:hypothetical protein
VELFRSEGRGNRAPVFADDERRRGYLAMFMQNSFGRTIELLQRAMSVTVYRRDVIADT